MALAKDIELPNGVIVKYHRIVSLNKITNVENIIEVQSYVSKAKRDEEKRYYELKSEEPEFPDEDYIAPTMNVFIDTCYIQKEYDENETIVDAYEYLKTTEKFEDAEDA